MISLVLIEPKLPGNVGAVARVMKNFGFSRLLLVRPGKEALSPEAFYRAKHAVDILKKAETVSWAEVRRFSCVIGTTAATGTDYNILRSPITPERLSEMKLPEKTALVLGREGEGLHNDEIADCDFSCTIPSQRRYRALNISHAAGILLYELSKKRKNITSHVQAASAREKQVIMERLDDVLKQMDFPSERQRETQRKAWKRILGKSMLTKREAFAVLGFLRKARKP
ncbi:MAG: RNA methyltransferase [Nanoarchaeota archaeon]